MSPQLKFATGLAATALSAWLFHGPAGFGERALAKMEAQVRPVVARQGLKEVSAAFPRDPMSRDLRFSGPTNSFQRQRYVEFIQEEEIRGIRTIAWDPAQLVGENAR